MRQPTALAFLLLQLSGASMAQGLDGAIDAADRMNAELTRRNSEMLDRGRRCAELVRAGVVGAGAMAQYRCILAGASVAGGVEDGLALPRRASTVQAPAAQTTTTKVPSLGPRAPHP